MSMMDKLQDEPLPKLVEALKPYKPRVLINYCHDRFKGQVEAMRTSMEDKGFTVITVDEREAEYSAYSPSKIESKLKDYDFVFDVLDENQNHEDENFTQVVKRAAMERQELKPDDKYFRIPIAPDKDTAKKLSKGYRGVRHFSWTDDKDQKEVILAMLNTLDGKEPRVSPWEAEFGNRKYLLEKACAVFPVDQFFPPEDRAIARELLREYSHIVLVNNQNSASIGLEFGMASDAFGVKNDGPGGVHMTCGGCGDVRGAIHVASTSMDKPNGLLVFESCTCENCGRFYDAKYDSKNTLLKVLDKRQ